MPGELIMHQGLPVSAEFEDVGRSGSRPNILLICMDQLRADALGCNGHPLIQTPHLDDLARHGVNFRQTMSECPVCCPARRILMTGRDPYGIDMYQNRDLEAFPQGPKLAELLHGVGYQTHAVGKMHVWPPRLGMGFEDIELNEEGRTAGHPYPDDYQQFILEAGLGPQLNSHGLGNNQYGYRTSPVPEWATSTAWTADRSMRFLRRRDPTRPFFLYTSFDRPHPPLVPPAEYYDLYRDQEFPGPVMGDWCQHKEVPEREKALRLADGPGSVQGPRIVRESLRAYAACITHIDARIGQLMGSMREHGLLSNTWIIVTADHGDMTFDHGRRAKGNFLAGSSQVPLLVVPPATARELPASAINRCDHEHPVGLQDLLPTLCDIAGATIPTDIPGRSLLPLLSDDQAPWRELLFGRCGSYCAAFDGRYRYQWSGKRGEELLFDQLEDRKDLHDLADDPAFAAVKARLRNGLVAWLEAHQDPHASGGQLQRVRIRQVGANSAIGYQNDPWNNRGWRG